MKIDLKFVELHTPLFLAGTNHGVKLPKSGCSTKLTYDLEKNQLYVIYQNELAIIPHGNIATLNPKDSKAAIELLGIKEDSQLHKTSVAPTSSHITGPKGKTKAQVSDPTRDLVFGAGN